MRKAASPLLFAGPLALAGLVASGPASGQDVPVAKRPALSADAARCGQSGAGGTALPGGDDARARCFLLAWQGPALPEPAPYSEIASTGGVDLLASPLRQRTAVSSVFGTRRDPILGFPRFHAGIDLPGLAGTPVSASGAGRVVVAGRAGGYGLMVEIDHGRGTVTRYGHLERILVTPGAFVLPGQPIGLLGSSGRSTGPHLHYEIRLGGIAVDPRRPIWTRRWDGVGSIAAIPDLPEVDSRAAWSRGEPGQLPVAVIR